MRSAARLVGLAALGAPLLIGNAHAAAYATGGSSIYRDQVLWLTWGGGVNGTPGVSLATGSETRASIPVAAGQTMEVVCSLGNASGQGLSSYRPGDWSGDVLDDLYNIGGTGGSNKLIAGIARTGGTATFTVNCSATLAGLPYHIRGLVMADAESINTSTEYVQATAKGTWTVVELKKNLTVGNYIAHKSQSGADKTIRFGPGNDKNTAAISFLTFDTAAPSVSMNFDIRGGGTTAIAIGLLAPYADFGDAPASYGEAMHVIDAMTFAPDNIPLNANVNLNDAGYTSGALLPPSSNFIGTQGPDTEPSTRFSADALGDDNSPKANPNEEDGWPAGSTLSVLDAGKVITHNTLCKGTGTVAGWIDFNRNGSFADDERAAALCNGTHAALSWTMPAGMTAGKVFARLRYAIDPAEVVNPTGVAKSGEAEDHMLTIKGPSLKIVKSSNAVSGVWTVNQPNAEYKLTVSNIGDEATGRSLPAIPVAPITVRDTLPAGLTARWVNPHIVNGWTCNHVGADVTCISNDEMAAGGSSIITLPVTIPEATPPGAVMNYASVSGGYDPFVTPAPGGSCTDANHCASHSVIIDATPALTLVKTGGLSLDVNGNGLVDVDDEILYGFVVTNTGLVTLTDVTIDDPLLTAGITPAGPHTLAPGAFVILSATYKAIQKDIDAGRVTNTATATGKPPTGPDVPSPPDTVTVPPNVSPDLSIDKTAVLNEIGTKNELIELGETITYDFVVTNNGTVTLHNVVVIDTMLAAANVAITPGAQTLAPNASVTFTATYTPTQAQIDFGSVTNTATAKGNPTGQPDVVSPPDTVTVLTNVTPGLTIKKTGVLDVLDGSVDLGDKINYSFEVTNTGNVTLTQVTVVDALVSVVESRQTLAPGRSATFTGTYTVTQADVDAGHVTNSAHAIGTPPSAPPIESPPDSVTLPPTQAPALTIKKTGAPDGPDNLIDLGETITYSFEVTNTGNVTLFGVTVVDPLVTVIEAPQTLTGGAKFTFSAVYTPTQADINAGKVTNIAHATGKPTVGPRISSPTDTVTILADPKPALEIKKTGSLNDRNGDGLIDPGETISYSFLVTNTGNVTLTGVTVDDKLVTVNEASQTLAPNASFTFTATYLPTQANVDFGSVTNTAIATGLPPSGPKINSPPDTVSVPAGSRPSLSIVKTGKLIDLNNNQLIDAGETVEYQFLVTNTGTVTLTGVTINDPLFAPLGGGWVAQTLNVGQSYTFTATYTAVQDDIDAGYVENTATATGVPPSGPPVESPPDTVIVPPNMTPGLTVLKTASLTDANANGVPEVGEVIEYSFLVTNSGKVSLTGVTPRDAGPKFGGVAGANALSAFTPGPLTLGPGGSQLFTATYTMAQVDIDNAAKAGNQVDNFADATASGPNGRPVVSPLVLAAVPLPVLPPTDITITKQAGRSQIWRGETIDFTLLVANTSLTNAGLVDVVDTIPPGFRFVDGSATVNGVPAVPSLSGSEIRFAGLPLGPKTQFEIRLNLLALATASPGRHVNRANVLDPGGTPLAPEATAMFELLTEAMLDCSEIVGKVFDDLDRDGYQDEGEPGLPGVRLATVRGVLITTDAYGRFSIPCAALPNSEIGSNFVLKLDTRTLPTGYGLTTDNPAVARLTAGKMTDVNFGASIGRQVRLDLNAAAFLAGSDELHPELVKALDGVIDLLEEDKATLVLTYGDGPAALEAGLARLDAVERQIRELWRHAGAPYELTVTRQTTGNQGGQQ